MVGGLIRDAALGQTIRFFTRKKVLQYPEEKASFECPSCYTSNASSDATITIDISNINTPAATTPYATTDKIDDLGEDPEKSATNLAPEDSDKTLENFPDESPDLHKVSSKLGEIPRPEDVHLRLAQVHTQRDVEALAQDSLEPQVSKPIAPEKLDDGTILVTWYSTDDPDNPQNWPTAKKSLVTAFIMMYTTAVYMGGSIYAPAEGGIIEHLHVSIPVAALGLSIYVIGYGFGPLLWSPLSEVPAIGRNPLYVATFAVFVILAVPTALVDNIGGLLVLRFLMGFFGSPALATGGATLQDMFDFVKLPYLISFWALAACLGPAIGPLISGFSVTAENWHWALWEILWLAGPVFLVIFAFMPETNAATILLTRARRLRARTGNDKLRSQGEIDQGKLSVSSVAVEALWRPTQLNLLDPAITFTSVYTGMMYALFYSFFEAFPLVYGDIYGFNLGEEGLAFLGAAVGFWAATLAYWAYIYKVTNPRLMKHGLGAPEERLVPALFASILMPVGMFIFGWTARADIHWIVPTIGIAITTFGVFIVFQCIFIYLPLTYPAYAASLFAGNDVVRSSLAAGAILYSTPLYNNLGVGKGSSLLASLMAGCVVGVYVLWYYGDKLRARSRFTTK